jgi:hypothetical protein
MADQSPEQQPAREDGGAVMAVVVAVTVVAAVAVSIAAGQDRRAECEGRQDTRGGDGLL